MMLAWSAPLRRMSRCDVPTALPLVTSVVSTERLPGRNLPHTGCTSEEPVPTVRVVHAVCHHDCMCVVQDKGLQLCLCLYIQKSVHH